ncbi:MAG: flagellar hook-associated protein FlgK [Deltaproteobacteria bacterium]|nr:MAG: flagellar hook-associated protein FlgK [Deltaproteobacteria bacterium]
MSINGLLYTARDALTSNQMAIDITGGNIANVNTPGYSRQRTELKADGNVNVSGASAQIGVIVTKIERLYDRFIEAKIIDQQQNTGYSDEFLKGLRNIEGMIDDTQGGGINDQLSQFWAAWGDLAKNPESRVARNTLVSVSENLIGSIASYKRNLDTTTTDLSRGITGAAAEINEKVREIADLTVRINEITAESGEKNDLLDKRTQALKDLGALINVTSFENADGTLNIFLANGEPLLQKTLQQTLSVTIRADGRSDIYSSNLPGETVNGAITGGKLGALLELQTTTIPKYISYIEGFTGSLADRVNELHRNGFDAYSNTGLDFFEVPEASNKAGTIRVNTAITTDVNRIAASTSVNGNGDNASLIATIQNELLMNDNMATLSGFLGGTVGQIGQQVSIAQTNSDRQSVIANILNNQRESVSGVSIDEEMIRLIKYQMGYNAAGKLVTVVSEMLDTLMGLVK